MSENYLAPIAYFINENNANDEWVIFLHAAFVDHRMFNSQLEYFNDKYNIVAIDILGHGKSLNCNKTDSIEQMASYINNIMQKHNIQKAHFVGVSLGCVFAQDFANKYQDKVASMACFGGYDINDFDINKQKENSKAQMKLITKALFSIKAFAKANKEISAYTQEGKEEFYKLNLEFKKKSLIYLSKLQNLVNKFPKQERTYPLLVGCGQFDIPMEIEIVNDWAEKENCQKVIVEGAGHCINLDKPQEFNNILEEFWKSCK